MKLINQHPWQYVAGWVIWAVWFVIAYGGLSVACQIAAPDPEQGLINWITVSSLTLTLIVVGYLVWCAVKSWTLLRVSSLEAKFTLQIATAVYIFAALGTLAIGLSLLLIVPCI
ncbi:hypothetical protein [Alteromonas sp. ASW11-130]|uniref:hypothetical protein n=1 Tax=Alteromonas sp. ASW11-130 TaxID=3015775 RepID=UPI002242894A|nr:hypothetical protein [Alteromonas sp. ASW11-130]MCW8091521.1 hypothetical protein [Alteromonas sp. ASW11-130]